VKKARKKEKESVEVGGGAGGEERKSYCLSCSPDPKGTSFPITMMK